MNDRTREARLRRDPQEEEPPLSGRAILAILTAIALACTGGYFFLLKMVDVSRQEDCVLAQRKNCGPSEPIGR